MEKRTKVEARIQASGSNVFIIPIEKQDDTWVGKIHSVGLTGQTHLSFDDLVIYKDEHRIEFNAPSVFPITKEPLEVFKDKLHCVLYYQILGKITPAYIRSKTTSMIEKFESFDGLDRI